MSKWFPTVNHFSPFICSLLCTRRLNSFAEQTSSSSPVWRERESGRLRFGTVNIPLKAAAELSVSLSRRLTDNIIELLHRLATTSSDAERLKAIIESSKPHIEALETVTSNSYERAQALVFAESRVAELRGESLLQCV